MSLRQGQKCGAVKYSDNDSVKPGKKHAKCLEIEKNHLKFR